MNLTWTNRVIKHVLLAFNLVFVITGIIMIAVGVAVKSYYTEYNIFLSDSYFSLPNLLIAIGSLIFFISFFGCCGAIKESWFMIFIFSCLLSIIFILEFSAGIAGYVLRDKTSAYLSDELTKTLKDYKYNLENPNAVTVMWDEIQYEFQCCGVSGPEDWKAAGTKLSEIPPTSPVTNSTTNAPTNSVTTTIKPTTTITPTTTTTVTTIPTSTETTNQTEVPTSGTTSNTSPITKEDNTVFPLPGSCCKSRPGAMGNITCAFNDTSTATYYTKGCVDGFGSYLKDHAVTIGAAGLVIAFLQLFGVIFACHLTKQLKHGFYST